MTTETTTPPAQATPNAGGSATQTPPVTPPPAAEPPKETPPPATAATGADPSKPAGAEGAAGNGQQNEPPKETPKVPEKYDLKLPENSILDSESVEQVAAIAKQNGLTNEQAQKILDDQSSAVTQAIADRSAKWLDQLKSDKELGPQLSRKVELASRVVNRFGSEELKNELNRSGFGNHPELVRILSRIGEAMAEDTLINPAGVPKDRKPTAEVFYGAPKQ